MNAKGYVSIVAEDEQSSYLVPILHAHYRNDGHADVVFQLSEQRISEDGLSMIVGVTTYREPVPIFHIVHPN